MKRTKMIVGMLLALMLLLSFTLTACVDGENPTTTTTTQPGSSSQKAPVGDLKIDVVPGEITMFAGDEFDPMLGVTANIADVNVFISDDGGFDKDTPGTYTITYSAKLGDVTVTATRTVIVQQAKSNITLEVVRNYLAEEKWKGTQMSFANAMYVELSADTELTAQSGIFKNVSDQPIVLSIGGTYGCSAILTVNGVVIEGRDGANGKVVNADNPERGSSNEKNVIVDGESVSVVNAFAKNMVIPAGGYAVVVQKDTFGSTADSDGRSFMNYNVIGKIGNVVRLFWADTNETLTPYVNQAPTVTGNNKILVPMGDKEFDLNTAVLAGLVAKDDNGVFAGSVEIKEITILSDGGFNVNEVGTYTVTMSVTDGELTTEFEREVQVRSDGIGTLLIGEKKLNVALDRVAINKELENKNYAFIVYTYGFAGKLVSDSHGTAFVLDEYGVIVRIYDGTSGKYHDAENPAGVQDGRCSPSGYLTEAFASLKEGETLLIAPNLDSNNAPGGSRDFLVNNKTIGAKVSGIGMNFKVTSMTITINGAEFTAEEGMWLHNIAVTKSQAAGLHMIIYDKNFTGTFETNGYGAAIVLNKYGVLVKIYDGANGGCGFWTEAGKAEGPYTFDNNTYAMVAFSELEEGETLIIFPNNTSGNAHRAWALDLRGLKGTKYFGEVATLSGFTFEEKPVKTKTITINGAEFTAEEGMWLYNTAVTKSQAASLHMIIYDKNFTGTFETNGYGAAIVLNQYGELVKVYDGANGGCGFWTKDGKAEGPYTFDNNTYAMVAFSELEDGETLIIFPNNTSGNAHRAWALDLRGLKGTTYFGEVATLTGFTFKKKEA